MHSFTTCTCTHLCRCVLWSGGVYVYNIYVIGEMINLLGIERSERARARASQSLACATFKTRARVRVRKCFSARANIPHSIARNVPEVGEPNGILLGLWHFSPRVSRVSRSDSVRSHNRVRRVRPRKGPSQMIGIDHRIFNSYIQVEFVCFDLLIHV